ncbi:MAG TPA: tetratricopeptide repeat protein [Thermoanaerobaculia bacterium]|jgi:tetratricopeptide (TPR) repeat protein|nr:tetratricopeptide repeat protein [Thermoanaerobaculia bacterium]
MPRFVRYVLAVAGLLILPSVAQVAHAAGEGRLLGTVVDEAGAPLPDVLITVTREGAANYKQEKKSDKRGQFTVIVLDATVSYKFTLTKEGFLPLEQDIKLKLEETMRQSFTLVTAKAAAPKVSAEELAKLEGKNQAIAAFNDGVAAFNAKDMGLAAEKFRQATDLDPTIAPAYAALGEAYMDLGKQSEALAAIDRFLELSPGDKRGLQDRYDIVKELGDKEKAKAALDALIAADPSRDTAVRVFNLGAEASRAGETDAAIAYLERALTIDPTLDPAASALGSLYLKKKDYPKALAFAEKVLVAKPGDLEAMTLRYETYRAMGDKKKAAEAQAAMQTASAVSTPEELYKQGVALYNANNSAAARATFEELVKRDPNHAKAHFLLGNIMVSTGENAGAKEHLQKFLELAPNDADAATAKEMLDYLK